VVYLIWILIIRAIFTEMLPFKQDCGFDLDVSVSRRSRDTLRPRSHLGWIGKRLGLSLRIKGLGLGQLGLVHKSLLRIFYNFLGLVFILEGRD